MTTASLKLCKELYELSGWNDTEFCYYANGGTVNPSIIHNREMVFDKPDNVPAYDLGYLLRQLPKCTKYGWLQLAPITGDKWSAFYQDDAFRNNPDEWADTPENAACKLCIELFKAGILTKEGTK